MQTARVQVRMTDMQLQKLRKMRTQFGFETDSQTIRALVNYAETIIRNEPSALITRLGVGEEYRRVKTTTGEQYEDGAVVAQATRGDSE